MQEALRQEFLSALGTPVWVPRFVLAGARDSSAVEFTPPMEVVAPPPQSKAPPVSVPARASGSAEQSRRQLLAELQAESGSVAPHACTPVSSSLPSTPVQEPVGELAQGTSPIHSFVLFRSRGCLLLCPLTLSRAEQQLVQAIATVLAMKPSGSGLIFQVPEASKSSPWFGLEGIVLRLSEHVSQPLVVTFGLSDLLLPEQLPNGVAVRRIDAPALQHLLHNAAGKRQLWQTLLNSLHA